LSQCWRRNRWAEGLGDLMLPVRRSVWRLRRPPRHAGPFAATAPEPDLSPGIQRLFTGGAPPAHVDAAAALAEAGRQCEGLYRLAGSRVTRLHPPALESLPDIEDRHSYHRLYWAARYARAAAF